MSTSNSSDRTLSLGDKEIPILFDGLLITKELAASLTEEELDDLQKWGEDLDINISQEPERDPSGYIYLAKSTKMDGGPLYEGEPLYKIGRSNEPEDRVRVLDTEGPVKVEIVNHFPVDDSDLAEDILHDQHEAKHIQGEWYALHDLDLASLANATGFEDGELTYTTEAAVDYVEDILQALTQDDELLDGMAENAPGSTLSAYMKWSLMFGTGKLFNKLQDRVFAEERWDALARFAYWYWADFKMKSSPPEEWDTPPERVVEDVLLMLHHHPDIDLWDTDDERMQSLSSALIDRCLAASKGIFDIVRDVMVSDREADKLVHLLMAHQTGARFVERGDGDESEELRRRSDPSRSSGTIAIKRSNGRGGRPQPC